MGEFDMQNIDSEGVGETENTEEKKSEVPDAEPTENNTAENAESFEVKKDENQEAGYEAAEGKAGEKETENISAAPEEEKIPDMWSENVTVTKAPQENAGANENPKAAEVIWQAEPQNAQFIPPQQGNPNQNFRQYGSQPNNYNNNYNYNYNYSQQQYQNPYRQPSQGYYKPQTNEYVYAPQPPQKKKGRGKAILAVIVAVLSVFVISVVSISAYTYINRTERELNGSDNIRSKVPIEEHQFTNNAEDETVEDSDENLQNTLDENADGEEKVNAGRTKLRDFPTLEQLATPDDAMKIPDIYDKVSPSVVGVSAKVSRGTQLGTGFIISEDGYILTNAHVIEGGQTVMVVDGDMNEYEAEVIGSDSQSDIAVLKVNPSGMDLTPVEFGKSGDLRIGELAIAIGNPLGFDLYGTMTTGIISGLNRTVTVEDNTMTLLQTSASINNGNSGGPLINAYGQVIGITSAKIDSTYGESLGFAIPIDEALPIVKNLVEYGYVIGRPSIGISGKDVTEILSLYWNVPRGVLVYSVVDGSGAQKAGIQPEDVIIGIEGETITSMNELNEIKNKFKVGDTVTLTIYRTSMSDWGASSGKSFDVEVVLSEASPDPQ